MVNNIQFITIKEVLSRVARHPMLQDVSLEAVVQYTLDFISIIGLPNIYLDKTTEVEIHDHRGLLPCGLVSVIQVRDEKSRAALRYMTDTFYRESDTIPGGDSFKTQGRVISTSFPEGKVLVAYKAVPVDKDELPMLPDEPVLMRALESFIKKERFTVLYDLGKIKYDVLSNAEQDYYWNAGKCKGMFLTPSVSEMQSITGMMKRLVPSSSEFYTGFKGQGDPEYFRRH